MNFDLVVDNKIKEAIDAGLFDNLPGEGKPLNLSENPHEPAAWRIAYKMLHDHGFTLPWIAERKAIEEALENAVRLLSQTYNETHRSKQPDVWARADWQKAQDAFGEVIQKLNKRIRDYNLQAPHLSVHRSLIEPEAEIARVQRTTASANM
jgi:DnaJ family protein C protein 28